MDGVKKKSKGLDLLSYCVYVTHSHATARRRLSDILLGNPCRDPSVGQFNKNFIGHLLVPSFCQRKNRQTGIIILLL